MKDQINNSFWKRVKDLIKAHKISQKRFAEHTGINYSTLKSWMHFDRIPDVNTACDIADALGVSMEYLVRGDNQKVQQKKAKAVRKRKIAAANIRKMALKIEKDAGLIG